MVLAYWLIGREIVEEIQVVEARAEYGCQVAEKLSKQLQAKYGKGFSSTNIWYFRQFYLVYSDRVQILHPSGGESAIETILSPVGRELTLTAAAKAFNSSLGWSHYRALMRVNDLEARDFYEKEAAECGWNKAQLERQIQSSYYERIIDNQGEKGLLPANRDQLAGDLIPPEQILKSPYILEFLNLPDSPNLHENELEQAILNNLQSFLLELGKGFSFVA